MKGLSEMTALLAAGEDTSDALLIAHKGSRWIQNDAGKCDQRRTVILKRYADCLCGVRLFLLTTVLPTLPAGTEKAAAEYEYSGESSPVILRCVAFPLRIGLGKYEVILDAVTGTCVSLRGHQAMPGSL